MDTKNITQIPNNGKKLRQKEDETFVRFAIILIKLSLIF